MTRSDGTIPRTERALEALRKSPDQKATVDQVASKGHMTQAQAYNTLLRLCDKRGVERLSPSARKVPINIGEILFKISERKDEDD